MFNNYIFIIPYCYLSLPIYYLTTSPKLIQTHYLNHYNYPYHHPHHHCFQALKINKYKE